MKKPNLNLEVTDAERQRIRAGQIGRSFNQSSDAVQRWSNRERSDVSLARAMGLNLDYTDTRTQNARLVR